MNMKSIKIFAIAAGLLALAACTKEQEITSMAKLDASKPAVASLSYDDATSGANAAGFTWSADAALKAGATSFTLELATDISVESVENAKLRPGDRFEASEFILGAPLFISSVRRSDGTQTPPYVAAKTDGLNVLDILPD